MNGHSDVNLPTALHGIAGCSLGLLYDKLKKLKYEPWIVRKTDWRIANHLSDFWVYVRLGANKASRVVFGVTECDKVNPVTHRWVRGKAEWRGEGARILREFIDEDLAPWLDQSRLPAVMRWDFNGEDFGGEYLIVKQDDHVLLLVSPPISQCPNWSFVMNGRRSGGWVPSTFLHIEGRLTRPTPQ